MLIVGVNLAERRVAKTQERRTIAMSRYFRGISLYLATFFAVPLIIWYISLQISFRSALSRAAGDPYKLDFKDDFFSDETLTLASGVCAVLVGVFLFGYLLYVVKERRLLVLISSALFFFMAICLLWAPLKVEARLLVTLIFPFYWMAVILFTPLQQLTRRLGLIALGVLTLVVLN